MSLTYQLNQQIHTLAQEKAKKHGLEMVIDFDKYYGNNKITKKT